MTTPSNDLDPRAREALRGVQTYTPGKPIETVKRELGLTSVIKLASNENALGPSPKAVAALKRACDQLHRYPDAAYTTLKAAISKHTGIEPSSIAVGNGSDELLVMALRAFVEPGEDIVVAEPTFLIYALQGQVCGANVIRVPLSNLRYDLLAMRRAVTPQTKLVFIANPDNPTGTYVTAKELQTFLDSLPPQVVVVVDEAYYEFVDAKDYPRTLKLLERFPLIVTRTFSKAYGLAGLRVGYGFAQPRIVRALEVVREPFNVNSLAAVAACAALEDRAFLRRTLQLTRQGRGFIERELTALGLRAVPSVTNFVLVEVGPKAVEIARRLLEQGVIVREMTGWKLEGFIRMTVGTMPENRRAVQALRVALGIARPSRAGRGARRATSRPA